MAINTLATVAYGNKTVSFSNSWKRYRIEFNRLSERLDKRTEIHFLWAKLNFNILSLINEIIANGKRMSCPFF